MLMALKPTDVNNTPHVSGRGIRRRKPSPSQRVSLAADLASGQLQLEPSLGQACELFNVTPAQVREELKTRAAALETRQITSSLVSAWDAATDPEREAAIRAIGVAEVWDVLAPLHEGSIVLHDLIMHDYDVRLSQDHTD
jgi:hypothetical protein